MSESQSTILNRVILESEAVRDLLKLYHYDPELSRRKLLANSSIPWMIEFNGLIVDARTLPPEIQAVARRKGLIPDLLDSE